MSRFNIVINDVLNIINRALTITMVITYVPLFIMLMYVSSFVSQPVLNETMGIGKSILLFCIASVIFCKFVLICCKRNKRLNEE